MGVINTELSLMVDTVKGICHEDDYDTDKKLIELVNEYYDTTFTEEHLKEVKAFTSIVALEEEDLRLQRKHLGL